MIALVGAIVAAIAATGAAIGVAGLRGVVSSDRARTVDVAGAVRRFGVAAVGFAVVTLAVSYTHLTLPTTCNLCRSRWSPDH